MDYEPPSIKARRSAWILKLPYLLNCERSGVRGIELYFPGGNAQVHHCWLVTCISARCKNVLNSYLRVVKLQDIHYQGRVRRWSNLVGSKFGTRFGFISGVVRLKNSSGTYLNRDTTEFVNW
jgi:hypothetical protein